MLRSRLKAAEDAANIRSRNGTDIASLLRCDPEHALSRMLSEYGGLVYSVVHGILSEAAREEIEECVSDAFLYVYEHRNRLDFSKGSVKAYLCRAAKSIAYDKLRSLLRRQRIEHPTDRIPAAENDMSAEESVLIKANRDSLIDAIHSLGEPDASILIYRYYFNMRSTEIAVITGLKQNTVDKRAGRALKKLAVLLQKGETDVSEK